MEFVNAIAKARFSSARVQRVQLHRDEFLAVELLCFEPGQQLTAQGGRSVYYVVAGAAKFRSGDVERDLPTGQMAAARDEPHHITNAGEHRMLCLAVGSLA